MFCINIDHANKIVYLSNKNTTHTVDSMRTKKYAEQIAMCDATINGYTYKGIIH